MLSGESPENGTWNYRRQHDKIMTMSRNSAHYNLNFQNSSLKLPLAILSSDRTTHHAPRTTHHAPRTTHHAPRTTNYTHLLNYRVNYLTADILPLSVSSSFSLFYKNAGSVRMRRHRLFFISTQIKGEPKMKNKGKLSGLIAVIAAIVFCFAALSLTSGGGGEGKRFAVLGNGF